MISPCNNFQGFNRGDDGGFGEADIEAAGAVEIVEEGDACGGDEEGAGDAIKEFGLGKGLYDTVCWDKRARGNSN